MDASWGDKPDGYYGAYSSGSDGTMKRVWTNGRGDFQDAIQKGAAAAPTAYASSLPSFASMINNILIPASFQANPPTQADGLWQNTITPQPSPSSGSQVPQPLFSLPGISSGAQAVSQFAPPIQSTPIDSLQEDIFSAISSPSQPSTPGFFQEILNSISGTPDSNPFKASLSTNYAAQPAPSLQATAVQTGSTPVAVQQTTDKSSWDYVAQHGNSKWQAIYLTDGTGRHKAFRNKITGEFSNNSSVPSLSGLGAAPVTSPVWNWIKVPIFTTVGVGLDFISIGAAIAIGIYAFEKYWRK